MGPASSLSIGSVGLLCCLCVACGAHSSVVLYCPPCGCGRLASSINLEEMVFKLKNQ